MSPTVHRQHPHPLIVFALCQAFVPYPWASSHILSGLGIILCIKHRLFQSATLVTFATISDSICEGYLAVQLGTSTYIRQPLPTAPEPESGLALIAGSFNPPHQGHLDARRAAELGTAMSPNWGFPKMGVPEPEYPNSRMVYHGKSCEHYLNWMITGGTMGILQFAKTRSTRIKAALLRKWCATSLPGTSESMRSLESIPTRSMTSVRMSDKSSFGPCWRKLASQMWTWSLCAPTIFSALWYSFSQFWILTQPGIEFTYFPCWHIGLGGGSWSKVVLHLEACPAARCQSHVPWLAQLPKRRSLWEVFGAAETGRNAWVTSKWEVMKDPIVQEMKWSESDSG